MVLLLLGVERKDQLKYLFGIGVVLVVAIYISGFRFFH